MNRNAAAISDDSATSLQRFKPTLRTKRLETKTYSVANADDLIAGGVGQTVETFLDATQSRFDVLQKLNRHTNKPSTSRD